MVIMTDCTYKPSILSKAIRILALEEVGQQTPHEMIDDDITQHGMTLHNTTQNKTTYHCRTKYTIIQHD